ncbi:MAG TPA: glycoside hydrolase family 2 TIM barrel-domain containing protein, partial [Bacilli bacterium]|nr:glycoside hydrolase family 2 TIM barrel-domain containing protein [Bacilli bacterium]
KVFEHIGGYFPFVVDITPYLQEDNEIIVQVTDPSNHSFYAYGKQHTKPKGIWYTPVSGLWQSVWLEAVADDYLHDLFITPDFDHSSVHFDLVGLKEVSGTITIFANKKIVAQEKINKASFDIVLPNFIPWTMAHPHLYQVLIELASDTVETYFGMRKLTIGDGQFGKALFLNNQEIFLSGVLDQGYYPDGLYTPAVDQAYIDDIKLMKSMGFNVLRKHAKIEPRRFYYHCDRLGMLVWQDMVNGGRYSFPHMSVLPLLGFLSRSDQKRLKIFGRKSLISQESFRKEMEATVNLLRNAPSLVIWTIFNEGWGQFKSQENYQFLKTLDQSRLIDAASGWFDQGIGDFASKHIYFKKITFKKDVRPLVLSEFGGYSYKVPKHSYHLTKEFGYRKYPSLDTWQQAVVKLYETEIIPQISKGLCATIYTQLSDVEEETNGLITYDREFVKMDGKIMKQINERLNAQFSKKH